MSKLLSTFVWGVIARILAHPRIAAWIIAKSYATPYTHLDGYMDRWWVFNSYEGFAKDSWRRFIPSARVHHIKRADRARHPHDHPWDARTIILRGFYTEKRKEAVGDVPYARFPGDTAPLRYGEFHHIDFVSDGGVFTLFITWRYRGTWGFLVDGVKIPHWEYEKRFG